MWVQNVIGAGIISSKYHIYFFFLLAFCVLFSIFLLSALNPVSLRWRCWLPSAAWRLLCSFQPLASSLAVWSALLKYSCMMCLQPKWVKIYGCVFIFKSYPLSSGVIKKKYRSWGSKSWEITFKTTPISHICACLSLYPSNPMTYCCWFWWCCCWCRQFLLQPLWCTVPPTKVSFAWELQSVMTTFRPRCITVRYAR